MRAKRQFLLGPIVTGSLLLSLVIAPFVDKASAGWTREGDPPTEYFGGGEDPTDHTSDPDEPFDGLDRIDGPDEKDDVVELSPLLWLVRLLQSMWFLG